MQMFAQHLPKPGLFTLLIIALFCLIKIIMAV